MTDHAAERPTAMTVRPPLPRLAIEAAPDGYMPGVCNIGPWEIRRRWAGGVLGLAVAALLLAVMAGVHAPPIVRALVLLPAWGGTFSILQARRRFCGAYAIRRISNFGTTHESVTPVADDAAHRADMAKLGRMLLDSFVIALAFALIAVALPL